MLIKLTRFGCVAIVAVLVLSLFTSSTSHAITLTNLTRIPGSLPGDIYGMSDDGRYYVFQSSAGSLATGCTSSKTNIYLYDSIQGSSRCVSMPNAGGMVDGSSYNPTISADGRFVAFYSFASNLVPNDTNGVTDVFSWDSVTGQITLESQSSSGVQGNKTSRDPDISKDGEYIAFISQSTNFDSRISPTNSNYHVYIRSLITHTTSLVSVNRLGTPGYGSAATKPYISADNNYITYSSNSSNLLQTSSNPNAYVDPTWLSTYRYSTRQQSTELVSASTNGGALNNHSYAGSISGDGRYITFGTTATNVVSSPTANEYSQIYVKDMAAGTTQLVTKNWQNDGMDNRVSAKAVIDKTGRYIAYQSAATNLIENDVYHPDYMNVYRIFVYDRITNETKIVSIPQDGSGLYSTISENIVIMRPSGGELAFVTGQALLTDDTDNLNNIYTVEFGE